jgi:hypothetical protein
LLQSLCKGTTFFLVFSKNNAHLKTICVIFLSAIMKNCVILS